MSTPAHRPGERASAAGPAGGRPPLLYRRGPATTISPPVPRPYDGSPR